MKMQSTKNYSKCKILKTLELEVKTLRSKTYASSGAAYPMNGTINSSVTGNVFTISFFVCKIKSWEISNFQNNNLLQMRMITEI